MTPQSSKAAHARALTENVIARRYTGAGLSRARFDAKARSQVMGFAPHELIGGVIQGDRKVILYADDLTANGLAHPLTTNDKIVVRGVETQIIASDDSTRRIDGVLVAYVLQVRG